MLKTRLLAASALAAGAILIPTTAWGQTTPEAVAGTATNTDTGQPDQGTENQGVNEDAIVVTGSRIRSPNLESTVPVTVVTGAELFQTGKVSVGDLLNELPQLRPTFSQQNSTRFLGTRGLNLLDLRDLGTQRTLVLVNGRRHVAGDILNTGTSVDVNTIPSDLVDRIDVVTGGNSSIYGSDAIAGVVNFILKDNYDGIQVRGQGGVSVKYNDAGNQYVSLLAGKNFAEDRGNIAIDLEYSNQSRYSATGRRQARQDAFVITDTDTTPSDDGVFDRTFYRDLRSTTISLGGLTAFRYGGATGPCGGANNSAFTCTFLFQPDGTLAPQTGTRVGIGPNGNFVGGNGSTNRETLDLSPRLQRYSANLLGHFKISDAFVPFFEAKYVRTEAIGSQSGPFFATGTGLASYGSNTAGIAGFAGTYDRSFVNGTYNAAGVLQPTNVNREGIRLDNPFLSATARATITAQLTAAINSGVNPNTGATFTIAPSATVTAAQAAARTAANRAAALAQVAAGTYRFALRLNAVDLGVRDEKIRRETYRAVVGIKGDFNEDWNYELSANYGEFKERNLIQGNVNAQRYLLATDTARNAAGQIVCRAQVDPRYAGTDTGGDPAVLAADIAACVPVNPFGQGNISQAAKNYLTVPSEANGKITQFVASGFVAGDLSQLFELPGGPISFSLGAEYRRETNKYTLDALTQAGYAFYNAIPSFRAPSFEVKEVFGEVVVPLVKDVTLLQELTLRGSGRIADYKGATGTVYAYSGGVDWRPIKDLRLRGTYSRSVRAPNLSELYSAQGQNFAPNFVDPCSARNISTGSANRAANCAAAGIPASYDFVYSQSLQIVSGGNPLLTEEKSNSYTGGFVFQPSFIPGLSISADYYDITVNNVISSIDAQTIANLCYDSTSLNNPFCGLFQRAGASGAASGEQPFQILETSLNASTANFAKFKVRGVDTNVNYRHDFGFGAVNVGAVWTRALQDDNFTDPTDPSFKDVFLGELGNPKNRVNANLSVKKGKITAGYQFRFIGHMYLDFAENYLAVNGSPPQNSDYAPKKFTPNVYYHDVRLDFQATDQFNFYLGVDNITNRQPPFGYTGVGGGTGIYDVRGRYGYVGAVAKF